MTESVIKSTRRNVEDVKQIPDAECFSLLSKRWGGHLSTGMRKFLVIGLNHIKRVAVYGD